MKRCYRIIGVFVLTSVAVFFTVMSLSVTWAAEVFINPTADTYVFQQKNQADKNFGNEDSLSVRSHFSNTTMNKRTLLMFNLSIIPSDCTIMGATLELFMYEAPGESRTYELYFIGDDSWTETGVTWNSQPSPDDFPLDEVNTGMASGIIKWGKNGPNANEGLTSQVSTEHGGDQTISLLLRDELEDNSPGNKEAIFASKEHESLAKPVLKVEYICGSEEGCSHGFWKNHLGVWPAGYNPSDLLTSYFNNIPSELGSDTLEIALEYQGGPGLLGGVRILLRNAVASLLNAAHEEVNYVLTVDEVKNKVNDALASNNRETMIALEKELDIYNNLCAALCPCD